MKIAQTGYGINPPDTDGIRRFAFRALIFLGAFYCIIMLLNINADWVALRLSRVDPFFVGAALAAYLINVIMLGYRWIYATKPLCSISLGESMRAVYFSLFSSLIMPARFGDFAKATIMEREHKIMKRKSVISVLMEKACDLFWMLSVSLLALVFLILYFRLPSMVFSQFAVAAALVFATLLALLFLAANRGNVFKAIMRVGFMKKYAKGADKGMKEVFTRGLFIKIMAMTAIVWLSGALRVWLCAQALGIDIGYFYLVLFMPLIYLISLLPLTPGGLGTVDFIGTFVYSMIGVSPEYAFSLMLLDRMTSFVPSVMIGTGTAFLFYNYKL